MQKNTEFKDSLRVDKVYFVIGESATRTHMSLYGYDVQTTPFLDSLARCDSQHISYYNALSTATVTRNAVPMIVTTSSPNDRLALARERTLLDLAMDAGYTTFWLSNHYRVDGWDIQMGGQLSKIEQMAQNVRHTSEAYGEDMKVLELLDDVRDSSRDKAQFFVIHLVGSHDSYVDRYDELDKKMIQGDGLVVNYDRSIHHTDRVLRELYKLMSKDESSVLIYMPDHGEDIGSGHGFTMAKTQFQVPLVVVNNSKLPVQDIIKKYLDNEENMSEDSKCISLGSVMYFTSEFLGYKVSNELVKDVIDEGHYAFHNDQVLLFKDIFETKD